MPPFLSAIYAEKNDISIIYLALLYNLIQGLLPRFAKLLKSANDFFVTILRQILKNYLCGELYSRPIDINLGLNFCLTSHLTHEMIYF